MPTTSITPQLGRGTGSNRKRPRFVCKYTPDGSQMRMNLLSENRMGDRRSTLRRRHPDVNIVKEPIGREEKATGISVSLNRPNYASMKTQGRLLISGPPIDVCALPWLKTCPEMQPTMNFMEFYGLHTHPERNRLTRAECSTQQSSASTANFFESWSRPRCEGCAAFLLSRNHNK